MRKLVWMLLFMSILPDANAKVPLAESAGESKVIKLVSGYEQVSLVELYTSEGCSSCPPAEEWLGSLKQDSRLWREFVPVAFHVDYWDYIGWKDEFARSAFSKRQRAYARQGGLSSVYTPGFVVAGSEWRGWFVAPDDVPLYKPTVGQLNLSANLTNTVLELKGLFEKATSAQGRAKNFDTLDLHVALLGFDITTSVKRGENRGRTLEHDFIVLEKYQKTVDPSRINVHFKRSIRHASNMAQGIALWVSKPGAVAPIQAVGSRF